MTGQPPVPPPGSYPPPPPSPPGGYPYAAGYPPPPAAVLPKEAFTPWITRGSGRSSSTTFRWRSSAVEKTGQPIGFGLSVVRQIAHFVDAIIC